MGFNTTLMIINDGFSDLEAHPAEFVRGIRENMNRGGEFGVGSHANPVQVLPTAHADVTRLYVSHGNLITELSRLDHKLFEQVKGNDVYRKEVMRRALFAERTAQEFGVVLASGLH